jgi:hypothetical protein
MLEQFSREWASFYVPLFSLLLTWQAPSGNRITRHNTWVLFYKTLREYLYS